MVVCAGIDLGNNNTKISYLISQGTKDKERSIKTRIEFQPRKRIFGGVAQSSTEVDNWANTFSSLKNILADDIRENSLDFVYNDLVEFEDAPSFRTCFTQPSIFQSQQIVGMFLGNIRREIQTDHGDSICDALIAIPPWYSEKEQQRLLDSAIIGGMPPIGLIRDIVAVALHYAISIYDHLHSSGPRTVAFLDIGHSDTAAAIVTFIAGTMVVHNIISNPQCGGRHIDFLLKKNLTQGINPYQIQSRQRDLDVVVEKLKHSFADPEIREQSYQVELDSGSKTLSLSRFDLQNLASSLFDDISDTLQAAITLSEPELKNIDAVELVGGSCRLPGLKEHILSSVQFGESNAGPLVLTSLNPDNCVAQGALAACIILQKTNLRSLSPLTDSLPVPFEFVWDSEAFADGQDIRKLGWNVPTRCHRLSDEKLSNLLEIEATLDSLDRISINEEAALAQQNLVEYTSLLWEQIEESYAQLASTEELETLRKALQDAIDFLSCPSSDTASRARDCAIQLETLHSLADPIEVRVTQQRTETPISRPSPASSSNISSTIVGTRNTERRVQLFDLGTYLIAQYTQTHDIRNLHDAIDHLGQALHEMPDGDSQETSYLTCFACALTMRYEAIGDVKDMDHAIKLYERAQGTSSPEKEHGLILNNMASLLVRKYETFGELENLERAIHIFEVSLQQSSGSAATRMNSIHLVNLASALGHLSSLSETTQSIDRSIALFRRALQILPISDRNRSVTLANLGNALHICFGRLGNVADLEEAIADCDEAIETAPPNDPIIPFCSNTLGICLRSRFSRSGDGEDIERAIRSCENAVQSISRSHPDRPMYLGNLAACLFSRYERQGKLEDLEKGIILAEEAFQLRDESNPKIHGPLTTLGNCLLHRFLRKGDMSDINNAVSVLEKAARLAKNKSDAPWCFSNLGLALAVRHERTRDIVDIDKAIRIQEKAMKIISDQQFDKSIGLLQLSRSFARRFNYLKEVADIDRSIELNEQALEFLAENHPDRFKYLNNLGISLSVRFAHTGQERDVTRAIEVLEEATQRLPSDHSDTPLIFNNLGNAFNGHFEKFGSTDSLRKAIDMHRLASELVPDDDYCTHMYHGNLGNVLLHQFNLLHEPKDINEAILSLDQAVKVIPDDHPDKCSCLDTLARAYILRFKTLRIVEDAFEAIRLYSNACKLSTGPAIRRYTAAKNWIICARDLKHPTLLMAYDSLLDILPRVVWLGMSLEQRHQEIAGLGSIACEAAAAALDQAKVDKAVEWLEKGRAIIWSQGLQLRTPVDELRSVEPALAKRLEEISHDLEKSINESSRTVHAFEGFLHEKKDYTEGLAQRRRALADKWEKVLHEIRQKPQFRNFLQSKPFRELNLVAERGPVVILNASESHCDAIVLTQRDARQLRLPATQVQISGLVRQLINTIQASGRDWRGAENEGRGMRLSSTRNSDQWVSMLKQMWKLIVEPVVSELNLKPSKSPSRLWWCPAALFTQLPLHAAGLYRSSQRVAMNDFAISSYIPTLGVLLQEKARGANHSIPRVLAIGISKTRLGKSLPMVKNELDIIRLFVPDKHLVTLENEKATIKNIMNNLPECSCLHLACHGRQDLVKPLNSTFLLHNEKLEVVRLIEESLPKAKVAVLTACQTAKGDESAPDEALHLAGAILFAGFRTVIATLWSIDDVDGPDVTTDLYSEFFGKGAFDPTVGASALHNAVERMQKQGVPYDRWVPFVSLGM